MQGPGGDVHQVANAPSNVITAAVGNRGVLALGSDGVVSFLEKGVDPFLFRIPGAATNVVALYASGNFGGALRADGQPVVWDSHSIYSPPSLSNVVALSVGYPVSLALRSDSTVANLPDPLINDPVEVPIGLRDVISVSASITFNRLALSADGTVTAWGNIPAAGNKVPKEATNVVVVAAGTKQNFALRADGTVVGWGEVESDPYEPEVPTLFYPFQGVSNIVDIVAGWKRVLALTGDGRVLESGGADLGFTNVLSISAGGSPDELLVLTGDGSPLVISEPADTYGAAGDRTRLSAKVGGNHPLTLQWLKDRTPIPGATNAVLLMDQAQTTDSGGYQLSVTNTYGVVSSRIATLKILELPPVIRSLALEPSTHTPFIGGTAAFVADVSGSGPKNFQWWFKGVPIEGATNSTLSLTDLSREQSGSYSLTVSNRLGAATSAPASLQVSELVIWGDRNIQSRGVPVSATNLVAVSTGGGQTIALRSDSTVVVWSDSAGSLPLAPPRGLSNVVDVAAGSGYMLALKADGSVIKWGREVPAFRIPKLTNIVAIAAGSQYCLAVRSDGVLLAFGDNDHALQVAAAGVDGVIAVAAYLGYGIALRSDGTVVNIGNEALLGPVPTDLHDARLITLGFSNAQALRADGSILQWGAFDGSNQIRPPEHLHNVIALANGGEHLLALRSNGDVVGWGANGYQQANVPPDLHGVAAIAAGESHSLAIVDNGPPRLLRQPLGVAGALGGDARLVAKAFGAPPLHYQWHLNGVPLIGATNATLALDGLSFFDAAGYQVVVSNAHGSITSETATVTVSLREPSNVNLQIEPTNGTAFLGGTAVLSATAQGTSPMTYRWLHEDKPLFNARGPTLRLDHLTLADAGDYAVTAANQVGTSTSAPVRLSVVNVAAWGRRKGFSNPRVFDVPATTTNAVAISASASQVLVRRNDGQLLGWGDALGGKFPIPDSASNLVSVVAGGDFSLGLRPDGTVLVWGDQAGIDRIRDLPEELNHVVELAAADSWALALKADGTVVQWGTSFADSVPPPPEGLSNVVHISAGVRHALAVSRDGTVIGWGSDECREVHSPTGLNRVVQVVAGDCFSMALREDGTVVEWGQNAYFPPAEATNLIAIASGAFHRLGLREDGKVISWGIEKGNGGQTHVLPDLPPAIAIAAAGDASFAVIPATGEPHLARQPRDQALLTGQPLRLEASVFPGAAPVTFQWLHNGVDVPFQTNAVLEVAAVSVADAGRYVARASNQFGSDTSREAEITVVAQAPTILSEPVDVVTYLDGTVYFAVSATGSVPLAFQWFFNGVALRGATNAGLLLPRVEPSNVGDYHVVVSNPVGTAVSRSANLQLSPAVFLENMEIPVDSSGRFAFRVRLSTPLIHDLPVRLEISRGSSPRHPNVSEAFIVIPAGSVEQCATIRDPALAEALTQALPSTLRLVEADFALVAEPAAASFVIAPENSSDPSCDSILMEPPRFVPGGLQPRPDGSVELSFRAPEGSTFTIETSDDLQDWQPVQGVIATDSTGLRFWLLDQEAGTDAMRFYRIRSQ